MADLTEGQPAPLFDLPRDGGDTLRLEDHRGKIVVLYFYPKDDTKGCTSQAIDFSRLKPEFEKAGAMVIGVSPDPVAKHDRFVTKHGLAIPLVADEAQEALGAYGVWAEKSMYGRQYMGVVRSTFLIDPSGLIIRIWRKVKVAGHAEAVLAEVRAI